MKNQNIEFCGKLLGPGQPAFIVAEVGFNHNGDVELAKKMIESAAANGADAVKLQTFVAKEMISNSLIAEDPDNPGQKIPTLDSTWEFACEAEDESDAKDNAIQAFVNVVRTHPCELGLVVQAGTSQILRRKKKFEP